MVLMTSRSSCWPLSRTVRTSIPSYPEIEDLRGIRPEGVESLAVPSRPVLSRPVPIWVPTRFFRVGGWLAYFFRLVLRSRRSRSRLFWYASGFLHCRKSPMWRWSRSLTAQGSPGEHPPIIDPPLWDAVQGRLGSNTAERNSATRTRQPSLLAGMLFDGDGSRMTPTCPAPRNWPRAGIMAHRGHIR